MKNTKYHRAFGMSRQECMRNRGYFVERFGDDFAKLSESAFRKRVTRMASSFYKRPSRDKFIKSCLIVINPAVVRRHLNAAKSRCSCSSPKNDKYYISRGIKCRLSMDDMYFLWIRDKAYDLEKPSLDRKNSKKDYTVENCQIIEWRKNLTK